MKKKLIAEIDIAKEAIGPNVSSNAYGFNPIPKIPPYKMMTCTI
jgi:hypothetical protein